MIRFAAVSAVALLTLAACERRDDPVLEPAPAPSPPQAAPTPPVDATVLTSEGLGPARIGMTRAELVRAWG